MACAIADGGHSAAVHFDSLLHDETVLGYSFEGTRYDCGSKLGYLEANVMYGLKHPETAADFARFLEQLSRRAAA